MTDQNNVEKLKAEIAQLQERVNFYQQIMDSIPGLIFVKDYDGRFELANKTLAELYNTKQEALIGKTDADFNPNTEEVEKYLAADKQVLDSKESLLIPEETVTNPHTGETNYYQTRKVPILDSDGVARHLLGVGTDITELKHSQDERDRLQRQIIKAQEETLQELSTPIIPLMERIIVLPIVGAIDSNRSQHIMRGLLEGISQHRAKTVILDITGVPIVDSGVADYLNRTIQAARLKGARTIITGISDAVAETMISLGISWEEIETMRDLRSGLVFALQHSGIRMQRTTERPDV